MAERYPTCARPDCPDYQRIQSRSVAIHYTYGPWRRRLYRCRACGRSFSELHGTPLFRLQLHQSNVMRALDLMADGQSLREVARQLRIDKNTALRIRRLGQRYPRWFQLMMVQEGGYTQEQADRVFRHFRRLRLRAIQKDVDQSLSRTRT